MLVCLIGDVDMFFSSPHNRRGSPLSLSVMQLDAAIGRIVETAPVS